MVIGVVVKGIQEKDEVNVGSGEVEGVSVDVVVVVVVLLLLLVDETSKRGLGMNSSVELR